MGNETHTASNRKRKLRRSRNHPFFCLILIMIAIGMTCCFALGGYIKSLESELPELTMEDLVNAQTCYVYDRDGDLLAELHGSENRTSVELSEISPYFLDCLVASEDIRFYEHNGVDYKGIARALVANLEDSIAAREVVFSQGASTLTMQLVRNVIDETEKTIPRKVKEALLAVRFEKEYGKDEILYYYVNEIYLGPGIYGVEAAANYYFNKTAKDLTLAESATIVGLVPNPSAYSPFEFPEASLDKRNLTLGSLVRYNPAYEAEAERAKAEEIVLYYEEDEEEAAYDHPWFVDYVISEVEDLLSDMGMNPDLVYTGGLHIYTTMDKQVQNAMETVYANDENFPESSTLEQVESGMAITEPATGAIRGLIGGRDYTARRGFSRASDLIRSPGSTIKPLVVYAPAVELGYGTGYVIDDIPLKYGDWEPKNDDGSYLGLITMRTALARSRNIAAVKMLAEIGTETGYKYGNMLGLNLPESDEYNLAIALGGLAQGVSPLQMSAAFGTFANEGIYTEPYSVSRIVSQSGSDLYTVNPVQHEVFTAQTAYMMTSMLTDAVNNGTGGNARISGWATSGKTGTNGLPSEKDDPDYAGRSGTKDAWFCGFTTELSCSVWVGYDNKKDADGTLQYLTNVSGGTYPARLFNKVMTLALEGKEPSIVQDPGGIVRMSVDTKTGDAPNELTPETYVASELFLAGKGPEPSETAYWQTAQICLDTQKLASPFCPNIADSVGLVTTVDEEWTDKQKERIADYALRISNETCEEHTSYIPGMIQVYICADPTHRGTLVLANIAGAGGEGGCPEENVQLRYYAPTSVPTAYCGIPEHQVTKYGVVDGPNKDDRPGVNWNQGEVGIEPDTPHNLNGSAGDGFIYLSWSAGNQPAGVVYIVERSADDGSDAQRYQVAATEYLDSDVTEGVIYTYRVYAYHPASGTTSGWSGREKVAY